MRCMRPSSGITRSSSTPRTTARKAGKAAHHFRCEGLRRSCTKVASGSLRSSRGAAHCSQQLFEARATISSSTSPTGYLPLSALPEVLFTETKSWMVQMPSFFFHSVSFSFFLSFFSFFSFLFFSFFSFFLFKNRTLGNSYQWCSFTATERQRCNTNSGLRLCCLIRADVQNSDERRCIKGVDVWNAIADPATPSPRTEILLNMNPACGFGYVNPNAGLRVRACCCVRAILRR